MNGAGHSQQDEQHEQPPIPPAPAVHSAPTSPHNTGFHNVPILTNGHTPGQIPANHSHESPLVALSLAAEQSAFQDSLVASSTSAYAGAPAMPPEPYIENVGQPDPIAPSLGIDDPTFRAEHSELGDPFDSFTAFFESGPLSSYHFTSLVTTEQPMPFFSFDPLGELGDMRDHFIEHNHTANPVQGQGTLEDPNSFSRFGSRLPSLQPEEQTVDPLDTNHQSQNPSDLYRASTCPKRVSDISNEDRQCMIQTISEFVTVPIHFQLPTRLSLARYIRAYIGGFHEHLPFLHIPSMSVEGCSVELLLAMAAVGAQYCFEAEQGLDLFHAARAIATERIRRRDARIALYQRQHEPDQSVYSGGSALSSPAVLDQGASTHSPTVNGPLGLPSEPDTSTANFQPKEDLMQSAQALLILMAMATWAKHKEILREALAIQSVLASLVRDDGLRAEAVHETPQTWEEWIRYESVIRTKYIVFCFFNLHCIVYDIPPLILNSELKMRLPCSAAEFKADTQSKWEEARARAGEPSQFQDALRWLFSGVGNESTKWHSSLGNYVLIHAIIQHIFFVRQTARCRYDSPELTMEDIAPLEQALRNWQLGWKRNPESSLDPMDPNGPVAFNSTALLRLAYIRLNMDTGPGRALGTRDPVQIANALRDIPTIKRSPKLLRALLHSAHALSIPVKIGIWLVAKTQTFTWSIQHSLCSLECALLLSKWLEAVSVRVSSGDSPFTEEEKRILSMVRTVLDETEFAVPPEKQLDLPEMAKYLNVGVLRVWATIFRGAQTWAMVDVIGSSLHIYADMLEAT